MPRPLAPAPASFVDPKTGGPAFGAYAGRLPPVELGQLGIVERIARRKRWLYLAIATDEIWIALAVVRTGYAATVFGFAYDLVAKRMLVDRTVLGPSALVADDAHARGTLARFSLGKTALAVTRAKGSLEVHVRMDGLSVDATIDEGTGPPGVAAIAALGGGLVNATEKRALLAVRGTARAGTRDFTLDRGIAGYDYTHGLLPRHTTWQWAYALGRTTAGEPFAFNVVHGFVGGAECAGFLGGQVVPLAEPRFVFDAARPLEPWRLEGEGVDLSFTPGAVHTQRTQLVVIRSRFLQPVGTFAGRLRIGDREVEVAGLPGVVEDQDVLW
ncbi:MAG: DUF2804 domain-containing protein [Labilithrix sp.]|nr:DUF2804 domain-containing protein [Labilithrix sp.]